MQINQFLSIGFPIDNIYLNDLKSIKSIVQEVSELTGNFEIIITSPSEDLAKQLNELLSDAEFEVINTKIVFSMKRAKKYTLPTLFLESAIGDRMIYANTMHDLLAIIEQANHSSEFAKDLSNRNHLTWLYSNSEESTKLLKMLNQAYEENLIHESVTGFSFSRQLVNYIFSSEADPYDVFLSAAISKYKRNMLQYDIESELSKQISYSISDEADLFTRFFMKPNLLTTTHSNIANLIVSFLFIYAAYTLDLNLIEAILLPIILVLCKSGVLIAYNHLLVQNLASRQAFAAANKKSIAGDVQVINIEE